MLCLPLHILLCLGHGMRAEQQPLHCASQLWYVAESQDASTFVTSFD